jgi:long-chain acyl-CoA synthetase
MIQPFDTRGITRTSDGIARYLGRPASLVEMLRATVEKTPRAEAIVELGGERVTYRQLWERSARVAGGLRRKGLRSGDRVAIRLPNGLRWCVAFSARRWPAPSWSPSTRASANRKWRT